MKTDDGRPYVVHGGDKGDATFFVPEPPREGDDVYCCGIVVGEVWGDLTTPGQGCILTRPWTELPPALVERCKASRAKVNAPSG